MKALDAPRPTPRPEYAGRGALEIRAAIQRCREAARRRVPEPPAVDLFGLIENGHVISDDVSSVSPNNT